jgi:transcriptional regulator of acetoin/glycerol metabolism
MDGIVQAKYRFLNGGTGVGSIPEPVLRSWVRCREQSLLPDMQVGADVLSGPRLGEVQEVSGQLIADAAADMDVLGRLIGGSNSMLILTNADGLILDTRGDPDIVTPAQRVALSPGGDWREASKGTNAIGTALRERRAVEVHGGEHFFDALEFLTCACAPILDPFGQVVGALDVTTHRDGRHPHTMGLVSLTVELIEQQMFKGRFPRDMVVEFSTRAASIGAPGSAVMVVREDGTVSAMNRHAFLALGAGPHQLGHVQLGNLVATPLDALRAQVMAGDGVPVTLEGADGRLFFARTTASVARLKGVTAARRRADDRVADLDRMKDRVGFDDLHQGDPAMARAADNLRRLKDTDIAILIEGETGTGKELVARAIHNEGPRAKGPFVAINCAAIPEHLIEAELFGYVGGAFTGASRTGAPGRIRQADGGTLLLDEIGDMPQHLQSRLLRVLQEQAVVPVGGLKELAVDVRVISATHRDLLGAQTGFRPDLFHRLAGFRVTLPRLRDRVDFDAIVMRLLREQQDGGTPATLAPDTLAALRAYDWPGNIRELKNVLRTAAALAPAYGVIGPDLLPASISGATVAPLADSGLELVKREAARQALRAAAGNHAAAARSLGISRTTLYKYLGEGAALH